MELDDFTRSYCVTALWSSNDESDERGGNPMDENYSIEDIAPETLAKMIGDCAQLQTENSETLESLGDYRNGRDFADRTGHDFWLNRNGHGAGFWDGDYPEPQASLLDKASREFGDFTLYIGDDGLIYGM